MTISVIIPDRITNNKYYNIHIKYIINTAKTAGFDVKLSGKCDIGNAISIFINGQKVILDFSDFQELQYQSLLPCFKFHCKDMSQAIPFTPVSFYDWKEYEKISSDIKYTANANIILNRQRPYCGARERRNYAQKLLSKHFDVKTTIIAQQQFWREINSCLVAVFVPGARNDMIDRGHIQFMAFGCCTISPFITDILPYNKKFEPSVHYIECKADYSDLIDKIKWCNSNRSKCIEIGRNAKDLFLETSLPNKLWEWVCNNIGIKYA